MIVGFIGLGLLGTALATRLAHAGFPLCGYDPDP
ncbi:MAG: NAD(P)-dependent oxidoreductase, partial [Bryobacterales bacterium]|nr:NAD(P)-dependent oxidoreductase [Bryobacterales bacterium]MCC6265737.1 NAD(P)-dependent oxidoreductase [Bryobacterales bacterium]